MTDQKPAPPTNNPLNDQTDPGQQPSAGQQAPVSDQPTSAVSRKEHDPSAQDEGVVADQTRSYISGDKEQPPILTNPEEVVQYEEIGAEQSLDPEVAEYMQRVEKDKLELNQPVVVHGQTVVEPANWHGQPSIKLPVDRQTVIHGMTQSVNQSVKWLASWCVRMFKKFQGRVIYSDTPYKPDN